jgi:3-oxoacyl-[acyl-carrier protein] reductase
MNIDLTNKRAIVCGSSQGIGKAIALQFAASGASVILIARNEESLRKVLRELSSSKKQNHSFIVADFSEPETLKIRYITLHLKIRLFIYCNNTGGLKSGEAYKAETFEFADAFSNHLICNQILVQAQRKG